jgi:hypothetical protein
LRTIIFASRFRLIKSGATVALLLTDTLTEGEDVKTQSTITKLIAMTMTVTAMAVIGSSWATERAGAAVGSDLNDLFIFRSPVAIIPGQGLRVSVSNPEASGGTLTLSFSYYLAHQSNSTSSVPFYESGKIQVPPGEFRCSDVSRRDLNTEGEPGTGRALVMAKVTIQAPAGCKPEDLPIWLEVINEATGATSGIGLSNILIHEVGHVLGFIPGQRVSYSFLNPNEEGSKPVRVQAYIYDSYGNLLTRTDPVEVAAGHLHTFDLHRDDLRVAGEPGTGRLQVRAGIQLVLMDGSVRHLKLRVSMALVDNHTGATVVGDYIFLTGNTVE